MHDLVIRGGRVALDAGWMDCDIGIGIDGGRIAALDRDLAGAETIEAGGHWVMPGGTDAHCHLDQPRWGGADTADDFASGSVAAAFGGTTSIVPFAMPGPGMNALASLDRALARADGKAIVDYGLHGVLTEDTGRDIEAQVSELARRGVPSVKLFMTYADFAVSDDLMLGVLDAARSDMQARDRPAARDSGDPRRHPHERRARGALPASHPGARSVPPAAHRGIHAMARYLTLAVCQTGPIQRRATRPETVERLVHLLERAAAAGADLAVFPEMALTTFFPRWSLEEGEIDAFYETEMPGPETQPLFDVARRLRIGFALGYAELSVADGRKRRFNAMVLVGRDGGVIGQYRKMHIPGSEAPEEGTTVHLERRYFEPGDLGFPVFGFDGVRVGMTLCNDRRWPETYRMLCLNGADVVLIGYNTPVVLDEAPALAHLRMFHNHLPMQAGAYQNTLWVAAAAKAGLEDGQALIGGSCIIAPTGEIAALAMSIDDEVVMHRADLDLIATCQRVNFDFARYRRPETYGLIAERAGPVVA